MTREEVKVEFTGLAHDHLVASNRMPSIQANPLYRQNSTNDSHISHNHHHLQPINGWLDNSTNVQQNQQQQQPTNDHQQTANLGTQCNTLNVPNSTKLDHASALSTIAILRRHPMYDSLILVKKYRSCLNGFTLEFPASNVDSNGTAIATTTTTNTTTTTATTLTATATSNKPRNTKETNATTRTRTSVTENDDCVCKAYDVGSGRTKLVSVYLDGDDPIYQRQQKLRQQNGAGPADPVQDGGGEVVYVPINGLLDRLDDYDQHGISIDSRVYAFAMGLKTAERFLTSSAEKEIQEAPPL